MVMVGCKCRWLVCLVYFVSSGISFAGTQPQNKEKPESEENDSWYGKSVFERPRADYKLEPMRLGSFKINPTIAINEVADNNIYAANSAQQNDIITKVNPSLGIESDWGSHAIKFNASGDFGSYADNTHENYGDYSAGLSGRLDLLRETYFLASATSSHLHEDRGSPDSVANSKSPTVYNQNNANISFMRGLRKFSLELGGDYTGYDYLNGETNSGGIINNGGRNRNEYKANARVGYEIIPEYEAFIKTTTNKRGYVSASGAGGVNRDSAGYEIVAGTALNLGGKTKGEIYAGYLAQDYSASSLKDIGGAQFGGNLLWNITGITSLKTAVTRSVQETTSADSSGFVATNYSARLEHELLYNLLAGINISYEIDVYESTGFAREDRISGTGAELRYLMNQNASIIAKYDFSNRDSNIANQGYGRSLISLGLKIEM